MFQWAAGWAGVLMLLGLAVGAPRGATVSAEGTAVDLILKADRATYRLGEPIRLTLQVLNRGRQPARLTFRSAQRYEVVVQDARGDPVWRWSTGETFAQMIGEERLLSGGTITYRVTIRERFAAGRYAVVGVIPAEEGAISASTTIAVQ